MYPSYYYVSPSITFGTEEDYNKLLKVLQSKVIDEQPAKSEIIKKVSHYVSCLQDIVQFPRNTKVYRGTETYQAITDLHDCMKDIGLESEINNESYYDSELLAFIVSEHTKQKFSAVK